MAIAAAAAQPVDQRRYCGGLADAAGTAQENRGLILEQALDQQQFTTAAKTVGGHRQIGQGCQRWARLQPPPQLQRWAQQQARVMLAAIKAEGEPVQQVYATTTQSGRAIAVPGQAALPGGEGLAEARAAQQFLAEGRPEARQGVPVYRDAGP